MALFRGGISEFNRRVIAVDGSASFGEDTEAEGPEPHDKKTRDNKMDVKNTIKSVFFIVLLLCVGTFCVSKRQNC